MGIEKVLYVYRLPISTVLILLAFIFLRFLVMTKVPLLVGQILQQVVFFYILYYTAFP